MTNVRRYKCSQCEQVFPLNYSEFMEYKCTEIPIERGELSMSTTPLRYHRRYAVTYTARPGAIGAYAAYVQCGPVIEEQISGYQDQLEYFLDDTQEKT